MKSKANGVVGDRALAVRAVVRRDDRRRHEDEGVSRRANDESGKSGVNTYCIAGLGVLFYRDHDLPIPSVFFLVLGRHVGEVQ